MNSLNDGTLTLRKIDASDTSFLYQVYASTRIDEMLLSGWSKSQIDWFLEMQFNLQHTQWQQCYPDAAFDLILLDDTPVGRFYIDRRETEIRIVDIAILPQFRGRGIGTFFLSEIINEGKGKGLPVSLHVEKNNPARSLYERMGFKLVEAGDVYDLLVVKNN
jgi:ribosomal protein S18 acetylase RimI-like enzyme